VPTGIITQLVPARRLGFVRPAVGGIPLLFNDLAIEEVRFDDLHEGQAVTYVLERDRQGRGARRDPRPSRRTCCTPGAARAKPLNRLGKRAGIGR
jgi:cold shock CspA family protein